MAKASTIHTKRKTPATAAVGEEAQSTSADTVEAGASGEPARSAEAAGEASPPAPALQARVTKFGQIRALLGAPGGASLAALCDATGWQAHSVRAALTSLRKAGSAIEKSKAEDGTTVYRIAAGAEGAK